MKRRVFKKWQNAINLQDAIDYGQRTTSHRGKATRANYTLCLLGWALDLGCWPKSLEHASMLYHLRAYGRRKHSALVSESRHMSRSAR